MKMDDEEEGMGAVCPSLQAFAWMLFVWIMNVYMLASLINYEYVVFIYSIRMYHTVEVQ